MATLLDQEFRSRLQALGEKFAATVPVTMGRIDQALAACRASAAAAADAADVAGSGRPADADLHQLHELLHGIAGSAGTFGFGMLGQQCRRVEQMLRAILHDGAEWAPADAETAALLEWAARDPRADTFP